MNIQILEPNVFIKYKRETYIKTNETMINSFGELFTLPEDFTYLSDDEIKDEINQNRNLLELALDQEVVHIRNLEGIAFLNYVKSFN